jgi:hypothetical protein
VSAVGAADHVGVASDCGGDKMAVVDIELSGDKP